MLQIVVLVLQSMGEFVSQDRFLLIAWNPVQHRDRLGLEVVIGRDLLAVRLYQKFLQVEVAREQAKFLHRQLGAGKSLREIFLASISRVYFSTSARPTSLLLMDPFFAKPVSSDAKSKIVSTDWKRSFASASDICTSCV